MENGKASGSRCRRAHRHRLVGLQSVDPDFLHVAQKSREILESIAEIANDITFESRQHVEPLTEWMYTWRGTTHRVDVHVMAYF